MITYDDLDYRLDNKQRNKPADQIWVLDKYETVLLS